MGCVDNYEITYRKQKNCVVESILKIQDLYKKTTVFFLEYEGTLHKNLNKFVPPWLNTPN